MEGDSWKKKAVRFTLNVSFAVALCVMDALALPGHRQKEGQTRRVGGRFERRGSVYKSHVAVLWAYRPRLRGKASNRISVQANMQQVTACTCVGGVCPRSWSQSSLSTISNQRALNEIDRSANLSLLLCSSSAHLLYWKTVYQGIQACSQRIREQADFVWQKEKTDLPMAFLPQLAHTWVPTLSITNLVFLLATGEFEGSSSSPTQILFLQKQAELGAEYPTSPWQTRHIIHLWSFPPPRKRNHRDTRGKTDTAFPGDWASRGFVKVGLAVFFSVKVMLVCTKIGGSPSLVCLPRLLKCKAEAETRFSRISSSHPLPSNLHVSLYSTRAMYLDTEGLSPRLSSVSSNLNLIWSAVIWWCNRCLARVPSSKPNYAHTLPHKKPHCPALL